jgi:poly(hydroxyalkanoate) depolymerase family esterase
MNNDFFAAMRKATSATRAFNVMDATRAIQDALSQRVTSGAGQSTDPEVRRSSPTRSSKPFPIDPDAEVIEMPQDSIGGDRAFTDEGTMAAPRMRMPLGEVIRTLRGGLSASVSAAPIADMPGAMKRNDTVAIPPGAEFLQRSFTCPAGKRDYKLYIPASAHSQPHGLVVMLHGCKQNPNDFAAGTGMNAAAERHGLVIAYPHQTGANNTSSCWNWFRPGDQLRGHGEPSIIAGITLDLMSEFNLDRNRVFVAGLSAGGAMAAIMGETYPDLYAAVGIHSGLAYGSANDVMSAFSTMRGDGGLSVRRRRPSPSAQVRTIVFQGKADKTVHPSNAEQIVADANQAQLTSSEDTKKGQSAAGRRYTRTISSNGEGLPMLEYWLIDQVGHAWSGGHERGSYTDPRGPDATNAMIEFFLAGPAG